MLAVVHVELHIGYPHWLQHPSKVSVCCSAWLKRRPGQQQLGLTRGQGSRASCPHSVCSVSPQHLLIPLADVCCAANVRIITGLCSQCWHVFIDYLKCEFFHGIRGYGAMAARLTPDQKVGSSNLSGLKVVREEKCDG